MNFVFGIKIQHCALMIEYSQGQIWNFKTGKITKVFYKFIPMWGIVMEEFFVTVISGVFQ